MKNIGLDNYEEWVVDYFDGKLNAMQINELRAFAVAHPELAIELDDAMWVELQHDELISFNQKSDLLKNESEINARFNELCFKKIEGINSDEEEKELSIMLLQSPVQAREWLIWLKTKLEVDVDVIYQFKAQLIKQFSETNSSDFEMWQVLDGELSDTESKKLIKHWNANPLLKTHWEAYQQSSIKPDLSVIYPNKAELKKEVGIIPLFWRASLAAASVALLVGLWLTFSTNDKPTHSTLADKKTVPSSNNEFKKQTTTETTSTSEKEKQKEQPAQQQNPVSNFGASKPEKQAKNRVNSPENQIIEENLERSKIQGMELRASNEIKTISLPQLVTLAPVAEVNWSAAMAFENDIPTSSQNKIWALVKRQVGKRVGTESFKISIDKQELAQTADNALQRISKGTLKINTENGKNTIALNRELFKIERNNN